MILCHLRKARMATRTKRLLVLLTLGLVLAALVGAPAKAYFASTPVGSAGPYLGNSPGFVYCAGSLRLIRAPGPYIGRAPAAAYASSTQTIWMQVRLERFNWTYRVWQVVDRHPWQWQNVAPNAYPNYAAFWEEEFRNIGPTGDFRISYDFRWWVGGNEIGSIYGFHHGSEYQVSTSTGYTFADGCHI